MRTLLRIYLFRHFLNVFHYFCPVDYISSEVLIEQMRQTYSFRAVRGDDPLAGLVRG